MLIKDGYQLMQEIKEIKNYIIDQEFYIYGYDKDQPENKFKKGVEEMLNKIKKKIEEMLLEEEKKEEKETQKEEDENPDFILKKIYIIIRITRILRRIIKRNLKEKLENQKIIEAKKELLYMWYLEYQLKIRGDLYYYSKNVEEKQLILIDKKNYYFVKKKPEEKKIEYYVYNKEKGEWKKILTTAYIYCLKQVNEDIESLD